MRSFVCMCVRFFFSGEDITPEDDVPPPRPSALLLIRQSLSIIISVAVALRPKRYFFRVSFVRCGACDKGRDNCKALYAVRPIVFACVSRTNGQRAEFAVDIVASGA